MTMAEKLMAHKEIESANAEHTRRYMMMRMFDIRELEYIFDRGWHIANDGLLELTKEQYANCHYAGWSIRQPDVRTLMIPATDGLCLIFEGKHFRII